MVRVVMNIEHLAALCCELRDNIINDRIETRDFCCYADDAKDVPRWILRTETSRAIWRQIFFGVDPVGYHAKMKAELEAAERKKEKK